MYEIYVVQPGDSVDSIASSFGISADTLTYVNQLPFPYALTTGQALLISDQQEHRPIVSGILSDSFFCFGYAYPFISPWVLRQTLPFLRALYVFSYGFTMEGRLLPPTTDDTWMIQEAADNGVPAILTLTPLGEDGRFNNALIHSIVNNTTFRESLFSQLLQTMFDKNYRGIDIDFEYILPEDRNAFTAFTAELTDLMHQNGFSVSIALAPKTSADQQGLLYEGKDYPALGAIVDSVFLMTYEWGYKYGPNMAVAPLNQVRRVVDYAVTEIPASKLCLGIPNYGYDWPLPYVRGTTVAKTIGNVEAVQIAVSNYSPILFDDTAQSPFFQYAESADASLTEHEVWFEDVRSIQAKFDLIKEYGLRGAGYWQLMRWWRANWFFLSYYFGG